MWELAEIEAFIQERCIGTTPDGETLLKRADALALLTSLTQEGRLLPAYVDVYSQSEAKEWRFEEDLTMRDSYERLQNLQQYIISLLRYLRDVQEDRFIALYDFADRSPHAAIRTNPMWSKTLNNLTKQ